VYQNVSADSRVGELFLVVNGCRRTIPSGDCRGVDSYLSSAPSLLEHGRQWYLDLSIYNEVLNGQCKRRRTAAFDPCSPSTAI